jgi:hypothetical protein
MKLVLTEQQASSILSDPSLNLMNDPSIQKYAPNIEKLAKLLTSRDPNVLSDIMNKAGLGDLVPGISQGAQGSIGAQNREYNNQKASGFKDKVTSMLQRKSDKDLSGLQQYQDDNVMMHPLGKNIQ